MTDDERPEPAELLPGYYLEAATGAWLTLPWPDDLSQLPPSLGPQIIAWCEVKLVHHLTGEPWRFTRGQKRFLHLWYAVRPDLRWVYRSGVKRGAKGTGKDPMGAAVSLAELAGPVRPTGWRNGEPVGAAHRLALVQIAANSEAQGKDLLRVANAMVSAELRDELGYDGGVLASFTADGSRIELLTNSERTAEGDPATAVIMNESHHMTESSGGQALAGVARRNTGKSPGGRARILELTNAHMSGEGSVAEDSFDAWQAQVAGKTRRQDILYDSREAPPHLRMHVEEELEEGIAAAYAEAPWVDQERIRDEAQDPRVPLHDSVRFYFNALPTNELAWVEPRKWDARAAGDEIVADRTVVAMFLDCSKSGDATALVGCRITDGFVFSLGVWQKPHGWSDKTHGIWLVPRDEVDTEVMAAKARYQVAWFGVDPSPARDEQEASYWQPYLDKWHREFRDTVQLWASPGAKESPKGNAVTFDMRLSQPGGKERNRLFTEAAQLTAQEIDEGPADALRHDGDPALRQHVHNARRRANQWGVTLSKKTRDSSDHVDLAVSMVGARLGRRLLLHAGKGESKKPRRMVLAPS